MSRILVSARVVGARHWRARIEGVSPGELSAIGVDLNGTLRVVRKRAHLAVAELFGDDAEYDFCVTLPGSLKKTRKKLETTRSELEEAREAYNRACNAHQAARLEFAKDAVDKAWMKPPDIAAIAGVSAQVIRKLLDPSDRLHKRAHALSQGELPLDTPHFVVSPAPTQYARTRLA